MRTEDIIHLQEVTNSSEKVNEESHCRECALVWIMCVPLALLVTVLVGLVIPEFVINQPIDIARARFLPEARYLVFPENREHACYIGGLLLFFGLALALTLAMRRYSKMFASLSTVAVTFFGVLVQVMTTAFIGWLLIDQAASPDLTKGRYVYFSRASLSGACVMTISILVIGCWKKSELMGLVLSRYWKKYQWIPIGVGLLYIVIGLLPSLYSEANIGHAHDSVRHHLCLTLDEFAAPMNGLVPQVSFSPLYVQVLPLMALPVFKVVGLSITSFTSIMAILSLITMVVIFCIFRHITGAWWSSLGLFLPFSAMSFFPVLTQTVIPGITPYSIEHFYAFNYYAVFPLRAVMPWTVAYLFVRYLWGPSSFRLFIAFFVGGLAFLNNADWGLPALAGMTLTLIIRAISCFRERPQRCFHIGTMMVIGVLIALGAYLAAIAFCSRGSLPDMTSFVNAQLMFASGYGMLPMPLYGLHIVLFMTFAAAIIVSLAGLIGREGHTDDERMNRNSVLLFSGIFGFGCAMYYVGRSHPYVLTAIFSFWAFSLVLLLWELWLQWQQSSRWQKRVIDVIPSMLVLYLFSLFIIQVPRLRSPMSQWVRYEQEDSGFIAERDEIVKIVKAHVSTDEPIILSYAYAHYLALYAGVRNFFPYSHAGVFALPEQADEVIASAKRNRIRKLLGIFPDSMKPKLEAAGYHKKTEYRLPSGIVADNSVTGRIFEYWEHN